VNCHARLIRRMKKKGIGMPDIRACLPRCLSAEQQPSLTLGEAIPPSPHQVRLATVTWMPLFDLAYLRVPICDVSQVVECTVMTWNGLYRRGLSAETSTICNAFAASMRGYLDPTNFPAMRLPKWKRGWISGYNPSKGVVLLLIGTMGIVACLVASFVLKQCRRLRLRLLCFSIESTSSIYLFLASP
jgi:hypothetical protein